MKHLPVALALVGLCQAATASPLSCGRNGVDRFHIVVASNWRSGKVRRDDKLAMDERLSPLVCQRGVQGPLLTCLSPKVGDTQLIANFYRREIGLGLRVELSELKTRLGKTVGKDIANLACTSSITRE